LSDKYTEGGAVACVGFKVGRNDGESVGEIVGDDVGLNVGEDVGAAVGLAVGLKVTAVDMYKLAKNNAARIQQTVFIIINASSCWSSREVVVVNTIIL
jgi:hypothetical protein